MELSSRCKLRLPNVRLLMNKKPANVSPTDYELLLNNITRANSEWMEAAVCASVDPELFQQSRDTSPGVDHSRTAKKICMKCPVVGECLSHALKYWESGVWGGTTEVERRELRRRRRA